MRKKVKTVRKKLKAREKRTLVNFKASIDERRIMKANAKKYTRGNVAKLIRLVAADPRLLKSNRIRIKRVA